MIVIDTNAMKTLAAACEAANDEISSAVQALSQTTAHNDWGCKERDAINDYTNTNKRKIGELQECSAGFLNAIKRVADDFEALENTIGERIGDVDASIANVISYNMNPGFATMVKNVINEGDINTTSEWMDLSGAIAEAGRAASEAVGDDAMSGYIVDKVIKDTFGPAIDVCSYEDMVL